MREDTWKKLEEKFERFPELRAEPVSNGEVADAEDDIGLNFPDDYRAFIVRYGSAIVGSYPVLGLRKAEPMGKSEWSVVDVNRRYRKDKWPAIETWLIVSVDLAGNPIGVAEDGSVWISDHDFGGTSQLAENFEAFLRKYALKIA